MVKLVRSKEPSSWKKYIKMNSTTKLSLMEVLDKMGTDYAIYSAEVKVVLLILHIVIGLVSFFPSVTIVYILATRKKFRTIGNFLNSSLLISGFILAVGVLPMTVIEILNTNLQKNVKYQAARTYLTMVYIVSTICNVMLIALVRASQIRSAKIPQQHISKRVIIIFLLNYFVAAISPLVLALIGSKFGSKGIAIAITTGLFLSVPVLMTASAVVVCEMKKSQRRLNASTDHSQTHSYHDKAIKIVNLIIISYAVTHILLFIRGVMLIYSSFNRAWENKHKNSINNLDIAAVLLASLDIILNPAVYFYTQKEIRNEIYKVQLIQIILCKTKTKSLDIEPNTVRSNIV